MAALAAPAEPQLTPDELAEVCAEWDLSPDELAEVWAEPDAQAQTMPSRCVAVDAHQEEAAGWSDEKLRERLRGFGYEPEEIEVELRDLVNDDDLEALGFPSEDDFIRDQLTRIIAVEAAYPAPNVPGGIVAFAPRVRARRKSFQARRPGQRRTRRASSSRGSPDDPDLPEPPRARGAV